MRALAECFRSSATRWLVVLVLLTAAASSAIAADPAKASQPGYSLAALGPAADGEVLDSEGRPTRLHALYDRKITVLSFIYATCDDANGCPLATATLHRLASRLAKAPKLRDRVRLLTLSFDPAHDTPERMAAYGRSFQVANVDWRFLTSAPGPAIDSILQSYRQSIETERDEKGNPTGRYSHLLRVYLIDPDRRIRNIYSASLLDPARLLEDIESLTATAALPPAAALPTSDPTRAGDSKAGYASSEYRTQSQALPRRTGRDANLLDEATRKITGLPPLPVPADNPLTAAKIELGRKLFYDRRLSLNNTISCAMCHIPEQGFTSQEQATAVGIEGRSVRRNAPTIYNTGYLTRLFHDGRESSLENQVWGPLLAAHEMANPSVGFVVDKLRSLPDYRGRFERAFRKPASIETIGQALASYERSLRSGNAPFDRWYYAKDLGAVSEQAKAGFALFTGKAGCSGCHLVGEKAALFTDDQLHNTGIGYDIAMRKEPAKVPVQLAPGVSVQLDAATVQKVRGEQPGDLGRYEITQNPTDRWQYRTPSLRNIGLTAPYMHHGGLSTLRAVLDFYNAGGIANENLDPRIRPLGLNDDELAALEAFLMTLTGDNIPKIVSDAWAVPVGDRE